MKAPIPRLSAGMPLGGLGRSGSERNWSEFRKNRGSVGVIFAARIGANVPLGPITSPRPGPTLASAAAAPDALVMKSSPSAASASATAMKPSANRKKKLITASATCKRRWPICDHFQKGDTDIVDAAP